jgi:hypothetical protein
MVQKLHMTISQVYHHMKCLFLLELNTLSYLQCKYNKRYLYGSNKQTFNIIFVNIHDLFSKVFGLNVDVQSQNNNWQFQY